MKSKSHETLDVADTKISRAIATIEERLPATLQVSIEVNWNGRRYEWCKVAGTWRFTVEGIPVSSAPRHIRAESLAAIEMIIDGADDQIDAMVAKRAEALDIAAKIYQRLTPTLEPFRGDK